MKQTKSSPNTLCGGTNSLLCELWSTLVSVQTPVKWRRPGNVLSNLLWDIASLGSPWSQTLPQARKKLICTAAAASQRYMTAYTNIRHSWRQIFVVTENERIFFQLLNSVVFIVLLSMSLSIAIFYRILCRLTLKGLKCLTNSVSFKILLGCCMFSNKNQSLCAVGAAAGTGFHRAESWFSHLLYESHCCIGQKQQGQTVSVHKESSFTQF